MKPALAKDKGEGSEEEKEIDFMNYLESKIQASFFKTGVVLSLGKHHARSRSHDCVWPNRLSAVGEESQCARD